MRETPQSLPKAPKRISIFCKNVGTREEEIKKKQGNSHVLKSAD